MEAAARSGREKGKSYVRTPHQSEWWSMSGLTLDGKLEDVW